MVKPVEQKVILDADGKPIFDTMAMVEQQLNQMKATMAEIHRLNSAGARRYNLQLANQTKEIQQQMAMIRGQVAGRNNPGFNIQDAGANQKLAQATRRATEYQRSIYGVSNALDGLRAKENDLNRAIAQRGQQNKFATVAQQRQVKVYGDQIKALQQLDRELARVQRRKSTQNLSAGDRRAVDAEFQNLLRSRQTLENAALSPRRKDIERELLMFQQSLDNFSQFVLKRRQLAAQRVRDERRAARELETNRKKQVRDEQRSQEQLQRLRQRSRLQDRSATVAGRAREISDLRILQVELTKSADRMRRLQRERLKADTPEQHRRKNRSIALEEAYNKALQRQAIAINKRNRQRGPADSHVQAFLSQGGGAGGVGGGAGGGASRNGSIGTILSPGYGAAALARTGVYGAAAATIYGLFNTIRDGNRFVVEFEDSMVRLQAISASTDIQMQQLETSIYGVARGSRFSTVELIKVSTVLAQAGVTAGQMTEVLKSVINLATAAGSSTEEAVQLVTSAIGAFQLQTGEAARVADLMTVALNRTKLTVQQTGLAIQYVGASAFENNITLEQLLATSAALAQAGVKSGSTIGTGFRRFLVDLRTPTKKLSEEFERLSLTQADVDVKTRGLGAVLETLRDAGFGATAAYAGLETRSAAFYLVAKNNIDIIDQLQLSFTAQNAAAEAAGTATDSLTAQWQRFSNIVGEFTEAALDGPFDNWKAALRDFNDSVEDALNEAERNKTGFWEEFFKVDPEEQRLKQEIREQVGNPWDTEDSPDPFGSRERAVNQFYVQYQAEIQRELEASRQAMDRMETSLNEANDAFYSQGNIVAQVEKEYERLLTQKESFVDNEVRVQAETLTLANRFEGLSAYLGQMENGYDDLTNALNRYRAAQNGMLAESAATYQGQLRLQNRELGTASQSLANSIVGNQGFSDLTDDEQDAVRLLKKWANGARIEGTNRNSLIQAIATVGDATGRDGVSTSMSQMLNQLGINANQRISNDGMISSVQGQRDVANWRANTNRGRTFTDLASQTDALLRQSEPLEDIVNSEAYQQAGQLLDRMERLMAGNPSAGYETGVSSGRSELRSLRQQWQGLALRQRDREEDTTRSNSRTSDRTVRFGSPVAGARVSSGYGRRRHPILGGNRMHSGVDYAAPEGTGISAAEAGIVKDVRFSESYGWVVELDHGAGTTTRYAHMMGRPDGLEIGQEVQRGQNIGRVGSTGRSTGPHLHFEALSNGRAVDPTGEFSVNTDDYRGRSGSYVNTRERERQRFERALDRRGVQIAEKNMGEALEDMAQSSTIAAFEAASDRGQSALVSVQQALATQAENDLMRQGIGPGDPEWENRMDQLDAQIAQTVDDYNDRVARGLITNLKGAVEAANNVFETALAPAQGRLEQMRGQVQGLSLRSNQNSTPDYVRTLAEDRVAQAEEVMVRSRAALMPDLIAAQEAAVAATERRIAALPEEQQQNSALNEELAKQRLELANLQGAYAGLQAQLSADTLVPTTIREGLDQAIEAYRTQNELGRTFKEDIIFNLGGGLEQAHNSINTFFADIFTGSKNALDAFGDMVLGIVDYLGQLAAQFVANQIFSSLLNVLGAAVGGSTGGPAGNTGGATSGGIGASLPFLRGFTGGRADQLQPALPQLIGGGRVSNGARNRDSVHALIAKDEWVVQSSAVRSVGDKFMADLNNHGAAALDALQQPIIAAGVGGAMTTNVWLVHKDQKPAMGPNDVLVVMHDDLINGTGKRLVKSITQGG